MKNKGIIETEFLNEIAGKIDGYRYKNNINK